MQLYMMTEQVNSLAVSAEIKRQVYALKNEILAELRGEMSAKENKELTIMSDDIYKNVMCNVNNAIIPRVEEIISLVTYQSSQDCGSLADEFRRLAELNMRPSSSELSIKASGDDEPQTVWDKGLIRMVFDEDTVGI